jgi:hypothetical protein
MQGRTALAVAMAIYHDFNNLIECPTKAHIGAAEYLRLPPMAVQDNTLY